jgi:hypothetical protein
MVEALRSGLGERLRGTAMVVPCISWSPCLTSDHRPRRATSLVDLNHEARGDPQEVPVEGGVVDLAQGHSVGDDGVATFLTVTDDMAASSNSTCRSRHTAQLDT